MSKSTIDVSKHATFKQLQALYANRQGNSIVGDKHEYNIDSVYDRMNELAVKQADDMIKARQAYEADINNAYPASWDNEVLNDDDSHLELNDIDVACIKFEFKNTIWNELTNESKWYWSSIIGLSS